jgi:DNA-binding MarR family transcriptional regulator
MKPSMCTEEGFASGWEVITAIRRFQHRMEVFMDQSLEPLGITFAQYRALEAIDLNREMHLSQLARFLRLSRQAAQMTVQKLHVGGLVDLVPEPGRVYVRPSELGLRHLGLFRKFTLDFKVKLEEELTDGERHRLTQLLAKADDALQSPHQPEWWLAP